MNRQAREDFGFWASEDYALMGKSGKGKVGKKKTSTRRSGPKARNEVTETLFISGLKVAKTGLQMTSTGAQLCGGGCTIS